jgi:hypothetical protein
MKALSVLAEIEHSELLTATPTAYEPGIWRYCLYVTGGLLPFMDDTYNRTPVKVNNVIVDHVEYVKFETINEMRERLAGKNDMGGWVNGGNIFYVRFPFFNPPYMHYSLRYGVLVGFTDDKPVILDDIMYRPGLLSSPKTEQIADALTYNRMKFNTASVTIDNSKGQFDNAGFLFGNEFNVLAGIIPEDERDDTQRKVKLLKEAEKKQLAAVKKTDEYITLMGKGREKPKPEIWKLAQYYIANITAGLETATFHLKDKRERLAAKIPNRQYTTDDYEYIDDKYIDKDIQEDYGRCFGVPGVCLEGKRIYIDKNDINGDYWNQYHFRFSSQISRIDRIQVKMTRGELGDGTEVDGWTTVYQRVKPGDNLGDDWPGKYPRWKPFISPGEGPAYYPNGTGSIKPEDANLLSAGEITLSWNVCHQGGLRENQINEVRMDGVFNNPGIRNLDTEFVTPLDIIKDILYKYASVPYDKQRYYLPEIENELEPLNNFEIGVLFDKSVLIYEAIEKLQSGSVLGFQFCIHENLFTARLDNPNRPISWKIRNTEILHLNEVEIDWNADLYGSYTDIEYAYNYDEKNGRRWIDKTKRLAILDIHRQENDWSIKTLLANEIDAEMKSDILLEDFSALQPLIKNIQLSGEKWFGLRIYDMVEIDFRIPGEEREKYPHHIIRLISEVGNGRLAAMRNTTDEYVTLINDEKESAGKRDFVGELRCQVLRVEIDTKTGITTIDVRVKNKSDIWPKNEEEC